MPSDREYDAQLRAVVEWRDVAALMDYRLANAITDALLVDAGRGSDLGYAWFALPAQSLDRTEEAVLIDARGTLRYESINGLLDRRTDPPMFLAE